MDKKQRVFGLDVLRSVAILSVLMAHGTGTTLGWGYFLERPIWKVLIIGTLGVEIFFVLSGFLIGSILIRLFSRADVSFSDIALFLKRRWYRTVPNYVLFVAINITLGLIGLYSMTDQQEVARISKAMPTFDYLFFLQNLTSPIERSEIGFGVSWSLTIEEWFYILTPLLAWVFYKSGHKKPLLYSAILIFLFSFLCNLYCIPAMIISEYTFDFYRKTMPLRFDVLIYGIALAMLWQQQAIKGLLLKTRLVTLCMGCGLIIVNFMWLDQAIDTWPVKLLFLKSLGIALVCIFPFFIAWETCSFKYVERVIYWISTRSYAMYVCHILVLQVVPKAHPIVFLVCYYLYIGLVSELIFRYYERPIMQRRPQ